jgi:hypothetical protein
METNEAFYGGRRQKGNRGQAQTGGKAMIVCTVEKRSMAGAGGTRGSISRVSWLAYRSNRCGFTSDLDH